MQSVFDQMPECTRQRGVYVPAIRCTSSWAETHKRSARMQRQAAAKLAFRALLNTAAVIGSVFGAFALLVIFS